MNEFDSRLHETLGKKTVKAVTWERLILIWSAMAKIHFYRLMATQQL